MKRPKKVKVILQWTDDNGEEKEVIYEGDDIESAEIQLGLWNGTITEDDLLP